MFFYIHKLNLTIFLISHTNEIYKKSKILIAPLDWGLGHTMRCVPIINELLKNNFEVLIAGNTVQQKILTPIFPNCIFLPLCGYNIKYSKNKRAFALKLLLQMPKTLITIIREHLWLKKTISLHNIDGVISDNRFGLYHRSVPSVFITHQLSIQTGGGHILNKIAQAINYHWINKFSTCWIPDFADRNNLAGTLSHPNKKPTVPCMYVGALSRLCPQTQPDGSKDTLLFIISGPEPQRTMLEQLVFNQLPCYKGKAIIVRGVPEAKAIAPPPNTQVYNHLPQEEMEKLISAAKLVICRSGYSSVMDLNAMAVKSILIPTPGQSEQEYLGVYLQQNKFAPYIDQRLFDLTSMIEKTSTFQYEGFIPSQPELLANAIADLVFTLKKRRVSQSK